MPSPYVNILLYSADAFIDADYGTVSLGDDGLNLETDDPEAFEALAAVLLTSANELRTYAAHKAAAAAALAAS